MSQTQRLLVIGSSGSGKTSLVQEIIDLYEAQQKYTYLVVLTTDSAEESPLSDMCAVQAELNNDNVDQPIKWRDLLQDNGSLFLEINAEEPHDQLERLSVAIMSLGNTLFVCDEAYQILNKNIGIRTKELYKRGRKRGVHCITISTSIMQRPDGGLNPAVVNEFTGLVCFLKNEPNEVTKLKAIAPEFSDQLEYLKTPHDGGKPEYCVLHAPTRRALAVRRDGEQDISFRPAERR